ncbi:MAG TPA: MFS transporter [Streptosporangiaceae bacterium]|nr:MFS transporter [Streptosporangiaceae bacterium]
MAEQVAHADCARGQVAEDSTRGRFAIFAIVSIALMMSSVDQTIVATALPAIQHDLAAQVNWSSWTITIYALGQVLVMPLAGKMGDQYGRKRIFLGAAALFTAASLCCGLATNIYLLIVLRAIQAIGGGAFMPSATGIVTETFGENRDRAVGLFSSIFPIGGIIGPILGGVFVSYWSWRGIFLVNIPIGVVLLVLAAVFIPDIAPRPDQHLDIRGIVLLGSMLLAAMLGIGYLGGAGSNAASWHFVVPEVIAVAAGTAFVRHAGRARSPFISLRFITGRGFGVMNLLNFLYGGAVLGFAPLVPLYAQERYGLSALAAGTLLTARAVGMIATAGLAVYLLRRTGYRWPIAVGFTLAAIGLVATAASPHGLSTYGWLVLATGICGVGMGISTPASNNATLQLAPEHTAAVAGLRGMFRQSGAITAVSITASVVARSANPGIAQAHVFVVFAAVLIGSLPLVFLVPEHRGRW